jgi:hypothetical protein
MRSERCILVCIPFILNREHSSMRLPSPCYVFAVVLAVLAAPYSAASDNAADIGASENRSPTVKEILMGLKDFYSRTARPDGSFQPGLDPAYRGISDSAYSDLAAVTYAVTVNKTFGWTLPYENKTVEFLLSRQKPSGTFFNVAGTVAPNSAEGRTYNTTQGLVALHALARKPRYDPLPVFEAILQKDYQQLPAF